MSDWKQKRFWKAAKAVELETGFSVELDGRSVKTPAKSALILPTLAMAQAIAAEWDAQVEAIDPRTMPTTRTANAAIDKVMIQHAEVAEMLAEYGGTDLLCYRAASPKELIQRQAERWDPLLDWATQALDAELKSATGVMFVAQDAISLKRLSQRVHSLTSFQLAAFHDLVSMSGSLVLGFAAAYKERPVDEVWALSRLDESWQEELWGKDDEASELAEIKREAFCHAARFYDLCERAII